MSRFTYDLHIHSCLSPCGDDLATPANLAGMAALNGLQLVALTDHNSCANLPAFFEACRAHPAVIPVAGMELNTAEEIHLLSLFPTLDAAMAFDAAVAPHRNTLPNRPDIFGHQWVMDAEDARLQDLPELLLAATTLSLNAAAELVERHGGAAIPAHIDREANGIIGVLGMMPETPAFPTVEMRNARLVAEYTRRYHLEGRRILLDSDAHHLQDIQEPDRQIELPCPADASHEEITAALIALLRR